MADALLAVGAAVDGHGAWQKTPLHIAAFEGHTKAMRMLLGAGADPWSVNGRGQTPSEVNRIYNENREVQGLLDEAVAIRRVISAGAVQFGSWSPTSGLLDILTTSMWE